MESDPNQEWSWGREIPKAVGRAATQVFVPKTTAEVSSAGLGLASGAALQGGLAAKAGQAAQSAQAAKAAARGSAAQKFKAAGNKNYLPSHRAAQKQINTMDPGGVANQAGKTPYAGPRPTGRDVEQFERGTGLDRGIPPRENPNLDAARTSARAAARRADPVEGHQLKMAKHRMKKEQIAEGNRKAGEEMVDAEQQRRVERFLYDRARNAPQAPPEEVAQRAGPSVPPGAGSPIPVAKPPLQPGPADRGTLPMPKAVLNPNRPAAPANQPGARLPTMDDLPKLLAEDPGMAGRVGTDMSQVEDLNQFAASPGMGQLIESLQGQKLSFEEWLALLRKAQFDRGW
jgi:hypothetical protein